MKLNLSRTEIQKNIDNFFQRRSFSADEVKKIKRQAMKYNLKLGKYRRKFCKKCLSQLSGKIRITKSYKTIKCSKCGFENRQRIKLK